MEFVRNTHYSQPYIYASWSKDEAIRYTSTSGGAFSEFATSIIELNGVVVGARYNEDCLVEHCLISSIEDISTIRQSKYLASSLGNIFKEVREVLETGRVVGFCGAPCQVAGLYSFLRKDYDNLYTFDFICRGMNSPKAYKAWLKEEEEKEHGKIVKVWFKYKEGGWKSSPQRTRIDFLDGHYVVREGTANSYMQCYLSSNIFLRPSCGKCVFKSLPRYGDITLADFWGIEKTLDDDKGTSLLLINSDKGKKLFDLTKDRMQTYRRDYNEIFEGNPMLMRSVQVSPNAHNFLADLDEMSFSDAIKKYGLVPSESGVTKLGRWIRKILVILFGGRVKD